MINVNAGGIHPALPNSLPDAAAPVAGAAISQLDASQFVGKSDSAGEMAKALAAMGLTPPDSSASSGVNLANLTQALQAASSSSSTDIAAMMALLMKLAAEQRATASNDRRAEQQAAVSSMTGAADKIKQAAQERVAAALAQGAFQMAGGAAQLAGGGQSVGAVKTSQSLQQSADQKKASLGQTSSQVIGAIQQSQADIIRENEAFVQKQQDAMDNTMGAMQQPVADITQQMMDVIRDIQSKLAAMSQAQTEAMRGIGRNV